MGHQSLKKPTSAQLSTVKKAFAKIELSSPEAISEDFEYHMSLHRKQRPDVNYSLADMVSMYPHQVAAIKFHGTYKLLTERDTKFLLDCLRTYNLLKYAKDEEQLKSNDSPYNIYQILNCYTGNSIERAALYLSRDSDFFTSGHKFTRTAYNLTRALVLDKRVDEATHIGEQYLELKNSRYYNAFIDLLVAVLKRDIDRTNIALNESVKCYTRQNAYPYNQLVNYLPVHPLGVYSIVKHHLSASFFSQIVQPEHFIWPKDYTDTFINSDPQHGDVLQIFSGEFEQYQAWLNNQNL